MNTAHILLPADLRDALENMAQYGVPTRASIRQLDVGTQAYIEHFESEVLTDLVGQGGATCRLFEGVYGAGKTHLLQCLASAGLDRGLVVAWTELSEALSLQDWRAITKHVLQRMECRIGDQIITSLPRILQVLGQSGKADVARLQRAMMPHVGFHHAMLFALQSDSLIEEGWAELSAYLLGEKVLVPDLRRGGIKGVKDPLTTRNAELVLATVLAGLSFLGMPGTMLLFDESERTLVATRAKPPVRIRIAANLIRRLIDGCTTGWLQGTVVCFAVLPGFLTECARSYPALGQRLRMPRGERQIPAWRWPVLPVGAVSTAGGPDEFAQLAIDRLVQIVTESGATSEGLRAQMAEHAQTVLTENASAGYRRRLMKALASLALRRLEGGEA
jgi:hypothetical protein